MTALVSARLAATIPIAKEAWGNKEVQAKIEELLARSRKGQMCWIGFVAVGPGAEVQTAFIGTNPGLVMGLQGMEILVEELKRQVARTEEAPRIGSTLDYHEFNCIKDPANFDFSVWLINAEMIRRRAGAPSPLRIAFSHFDEVMAPEQKIIDNVHRQLLPLIGAVEDDDAIGGCRGAQFTPSQICTAYKRGETVPKYCAPQLNMWQVAAWLSQWGNKKPVTITLREAAHFTDRNTSLDGFLKFARELRDKGELVVFVRDTARANEALEDFIIYPQASISIGIRCALYAQAKCNLFTSNGPFGLALFSDTNYLCFMRPLVPGDSYWPNDPEWWRLQNGITEGDQWPWALPRQRMVWKSEVYENIAAAWEEFGPWA